MGEAQAARVFIGYAAADEKHRVRLEMHLTALRHEGLIDVWYQGRTAPGVAWEAAVLAELDRADMVLFLISADFVASREAWDRDLVRAFERRARRGTRLVPIRVRSVELGGTPLAKLQALPVSGPPIAESESEEAAWADLASVLRAMLLERANAPARATRGNDLVDRGRRELVVSVASIARLRAPDAEVTEHDAPQPFAGLVVVIQRAGRAVEVEPIGVLDGSITSDALDVFTAEMEAPYRRDNPLLHARIVNTGDAAPDDLFRRARRGGVVLEQFTDYQTIVDFTRYLRWQTDRVDRDPQYPERLYVDQRAEVRIRLDREWTNDALSTLVDLLMDPHPRFILVLGDFGTGKTFLLRQLTRRLAEKYAQSPKEALFPMLVEMRALDKSLGLDKLLAQHFQIPGGGEIRVAAFRYLLSVGRVALLFDGFDELAFRVTYDRAVEHFETVLEATQGRAKVVVTSRTAHFLNDRDVELALARRAAGVDGYRLVKLSTFDEEQIHCALVKRLPAVEEANRRMALLREVEDLMGLSANPRMLGFVLELPTSDLEEARTKRGRITSATLYELLITKWLEGEVERATPRGAEPALTLPQLWQAVTELALLIWPRTEKGIVLGDIPPALWASLQRIDPSRPLDVQQATASAGSRSLLVRDDDGRFSFWHESILDWLVARATAVQVREAGSAPALEQKAMNDLMADFFGALVGRERTVAWAHSAMMEGSNVAIANANRVLRRLGAEAAEDTSVDVVLDLSGHDLRGQDLSGSTHLRGASLERADFSGATLVGANLSGANLANAKLTGVNAEKAVLQGVHLAGADLSHARLLGADLHDAMLAGSRLRYGKLVGAGLDSQSADGADTFGSAHHRPSAAVPATLGGSRPSRPMRLAVTPDGALLAAGYGGGVVVVWDVSSGRPIRHWIAHETHITALAFCGIAEESATLATGSGDRSIRLWDVMSGRLLQSLEAHTGSIQSIAFSPAGEALASGAADGTVKLWEVQSGRLQRSLQAHLSVVWSVAFSPDGKTLASGSSDGTVKLWDVEAGDILHSRGVHASWVLSVAFSPDGTTLASGSADSTVKLWDARSGHLLRSVGGHSDWVLSIAFSPDCKTLASGSADKTIKLWDTESGEVLHSIKTNGYWVASLAFLPDGHTVAAGSDDVTLGLWDTKNGQSVRSFRMPPGTGAAWSLAFSPDGQTFVSCIESGTIKVWDARNGRLLRSLDDGFRRALSAAISPDGAQPASSFLDADMRLSLVNSGQLSCLLEGHSGTVRGVASSSDGQHLASVSDDGTVRLWDVRHKQFLRSFKGHGGSVLSISFTPDGETLVSGSADHMVNLWSVESGRLLRSLAGHAGWVYSVAFSPDGGILASASGDRTVKLWDPKSGQLQRSLKGHSNRVSAVLFSRDGELLASGSADRTVKLWEAGSGTLLRSFEGHSGGVQGVAFHPGGQLLASASLDGTLRLWRVADGTCLAVFVATEQGWAAFTPDGRYKIKGDVSGRFWHVVGLCRFEPGELDDYVDAFTGHPPVRLGEDDPLW